LEYPTNSSKEAETIQRDRKAHFTVFSTQPWKLKCWFRCFISQNDLI